jgi:hypothetical protein
VINDEIAQLTTGNQTEAIIAIFMFPSAFLPDGWVHGTPIEDGECVTVTLEATKPTSIDGYTPKNKKLLSYPYSLLHVTNQIGQAGDLRYEYFDSDRCVFFQECSLSPSPTVFMFPQNYAGQYLNKEASLSLSGFPFCSWNYDVFKSWLSQNAANIGVSGALGISSIVIGAATANPIVTVAGIAAVASEIGPFYQAATAPPQAKGNTGNGSTSYSINMGEFNLVHMSIKQEFAKRIDDYFEMFGYKIDRVKTPNLASRTYWNYIQTIGINITGNIPDEDMRELKAIYDSGITLWHSTAHFIDYSMNNH